MITVLYRPNSEQARQVEEFLHELDRERIEYKTLDIDSREGINFAQVHDVLQFPSVLATKNDGSLIQSWLGVLPLVKEVGYFAHQ